MSKSPFTCNHERLGKMIAGGPMQCLDCGHIPSDYALGQLERAQILKARVKELEAELSKLKKAYDVVSAYATHFTPDHKLEDKLKEENKAYE